MSQVPPPSSMPYPPQGFQPPPQARTNGAAIASLICGIIGCFTPAGIAAIILGIVGIVIAKKPGGSGKGMSIAGIVLGSLWLIFAIAGFIFLLSAPKWAPSIASRFFKAPVQQVGTSFINDLANGNTQAASAFTTGDISTESLTALGAELKSYGAFKSLSVGNIAFDPNAPDAKLHLTVTGSLQFESATKNFEATVTTDKSGSSGKPFKIENFKIK